MFTNRCMDKEDLVHIYNAIIFSHKKEQILVCCTKVNEPRDSYTEWSQKEKNKYHALTHVLSCSATSSSVTLWTMVHQAPLSIGFSRQEYWSQQPFLSPGDLPKPRDQIQVSCLEGRFFTIWAIREGHINAYMWNLEKWYGWNYL